MGGAEEVAAGTDLADGVERQGVVVDLDRLHGLGHHLQHLGVQHHLLEGGAEPALQPAGAVIDHVGAAHHGAPDRHLALVRGLRVGGVAGVRVGGAVRQPVAPRQLPGDQLRLAVLRRAEGGRAGAHVDVGGEGAVDGGRAGPHRLHQRDAGQRLGVLLRQRRRQRHRRHRPHQRERRHHHALAPARHGDQAIRHRPVESARRVDRDDGERAGIVGELLARQAAGDRDHVDAVERPSRADRRVVVDAVGAGQVGQVAIQVAGFRRQVDRRGRLVADHVHDVQRLRQPQQLAVVLVVALAATVDPVVHAGRTGDQAEVDGVAAQAHRVVRVARGQHHLGRRLGGQIGDQGAVKAHEAAGMIDVGSGRLQDRQRLGTHEFDADLLQDPHRGVVDPFDLLVVEDAQGRVGVLDAGPGKLAHAAGGAARGGTAAAGHGRGSPLSRSEPPWPRLAGWPGGARKNVRAGRSRALLRSRSTVP